MDNSFGTPLHYARMAFLEKDSKFQTEKPYLYLLPTNGSFPVTNCTFKTSKVRITDIRSPTPSTSFEIDGFIVLQRPLREKNLWIIAPVSSFGACMVLPSIKFNPSASMVRLASFWRMVDTSRKKWRARVVSGSCSWIPGSSSLWRSDAASESLKAITRVARIHTESAFRSNVLPEIFSAKRADSRGCLRNR